MCLTSGLIEMQHVLEAVEQRCGVWLEDDAGTDLAPFITTAGT